MTRTVKIHEAKTHLSALLTEVADGEDVVIARGDTPVARLTPIHSPEKRPLGLMRFTVPQSFDEPLDDSELGAWEGDGEGLLTAVVDQDVERRQARANATLAAKVQAAGGTV